MCTATHPGLRTERINIRKKLDTLQPRLWSIKKGETVHTQGDSSRCTGRNPRSTASGSQDAQTPGETEGDLGRAVSKGSHRSGRCHAGIQSCQLSYMYMSVTHIERAAHK